MTDKKPPGTVVQLTALQSDGTYAAAKPIQTENLNLDNPTDVAKALVRPLKHCSPTAFCCLARCPRRFFFQKLCGLYDPLIPRTALQYGTAMHYALPHCYNGDLGSAIAAFASAFGSTPTDDMRNPGRAALTLREFIRTHTGAETKYEIVVTPQVVKPADKVSDIELPFVIDIGIPLPIVGRIDAIARLMGTGKTCPVEFKTSREAGQRFMGGFGLNPQFLTYDLAHWVLLNERPEGVILEALITGRKEASIITMPIPYTAYQVESVIDWFKDMYREYDIFINRLMIDNEQFPKNLAACTTYASFGEPGYTCEYQKLCSVEDWPKLLSLYEQEPVKPFLESEIEEDKTKTDVVRPAYL